MNQRIVVVDKDLNERKAKILQVLGHHGLERVEIEEAKAGDILGSPIKDGDGWGV